MSDESLPNTGGVGDRFWAVLIFVMAGLAFWPVLYWLASTLAAREQLYTGAMVLLVAGAHHWRNRASRVPLVLRFGRLGLWCAAVSLFLLAVAKWFPTVALFAACLALLAGILFLFGDGAWRPATKAVGVFTVFVVLVWLMPAFDWPLRRLAGQNVGWIFHQLGQDVRLLVKTLEGAPSLLLEVGGRPFVVAPECNGFGIISGTLLLSLVVLVLQKRPLFDRGLDLLLCLLLAFLANITRITIIILLASRVDDYHQMHETVGLAVLFGTFGLVWLWLHPRRKGFSTAPFPSAGHS